MGKTTLYGATFLKGTTDKTFLSMIIQIGEKTFMGNMTVIYYKDVFIDIRISWLTVSNAVLRSRKATVLTLPISILQASNKAVTIEWSTMESGFWFLEKILWSNRIGKEVMIDNSFKYFANYRDNWYCTMIVYAASFATYLNREVTLADFQSS